MIGRFTPSDLQVFGISWYLARELGPRGIAVNTLAPGAIETDFAGGLVRDNKEINAFVASTTAMARNCLKYSFVSRSAEGR